MAGETMSADGWVKLWRRLEDSDIWELPPTTIKIWIWLLMHANHETRTVYGINVEPGELITSYDSICKGIAWKEKGGHVTTATPNQVRWAIKCLEARQTLVRYPHQQHLHLKVLNWSKFQNTTPAPQQDHDRPHDNATTDSRQTHDSKQEGRSRTKEEKNYAPRFDEFWKMYPRKKDKGHAERAWSAAVKTTDTDVILAGLRRLLPSMKDEDQQYIKYPATWLNGQCWEDESPPEEDALLELTFERNRHPRAVR
jgi:hypothetical protein